MSMNTQHFEGDSIDGQVWINGRWQQIVPREMVEEDIYPTAPHLYYSVYGVRSFIAWARNERTKALMANHRRLSERFRELQNTADAKQDALNLRIGQVESLQQTLDEYHVELNKETRQRVQLERQVDELESDLRSVTSLKNRFLRTTQRRDKQITELENVVKVNDDFIKLQSARLCKAREMIQRMATAAGLHIPDESSLDP